MKNPLNKRIIREFFQDIGKYIVIFLLLVISIGFVSGFLVAGRSMAKAFDDGFEKYNIEDGHFTSADKLKPSDITLIEKNDVTLYNLFYTEKETEGNTNTTLRIYPERKEVNTVCLMKGSLPSKDNEIAIDRMYAENNSLECQDVLICDGEEYTITGFVALPDYSALFYSNNDIMFDAKQFGVAIVTEDKFTEYSDDDITFNYAWKYYDPPAIEQDKKDTAEDLAESISRDIELVEFTPEYLNQSIHFAGDDVESDRAMMEVFLWIIIAITAFVFSVTITNTIYKEANVIGTLRASGYSRGELVRHYMAAPLIVTLISALIGNITGYGIFKDVCASLYYSSYSFGTYTTIWSPEALIKTTLIPVALMTGITFVILSYKLSLSPMKFLRRDLKRNSNKRAIRLDKRLPFFDRFRLRVLIQNKSSYIILFAGLFFANILLFFGMMLPALMRHYQDTISDTMLARYTYLIQIPQGAVDSDNEISAALSMVKIQGDISTSNPDAEKFSAYTLKTTGNDNSRIEDITIYGIDEDSSYIDYDFDDKTVLASSAFADKYNTKAGDVVTFKEPYDDKYYGFRLSGVYTYDGSVCLFMSREHLNKVMGFDDEFFAGYFSDSEIDDIPSRFLGTIIDEESLTRVSRQLMISMGELMYIVDGFSIVLFMVLVYLLSKIIIERNAQSISMAKILGYDRKEISALYIRPTTIFVIISLLVSYPLITWLVVWIFKVMLRQMMSGWIMIWLDPFAYIRMFLLAIITYAIVAVLEYAKVGRIPMDEALKNVE